MECVYCVGLLKCALDFCDKEFSFVSKLFIDIICEVVVAPPTKIMIGVRFHPLIAILLMNNCYFTVFLSRASMANLSLQYVNLIDCMVSFGAWFCGGGGCMDGP